MEDSIFDDDAGSSDYVPEVAPVCLFILHTHPSGTENSKFFLADDMPN
jgi:hypothetical protein